MKQVEQHGAPLLHHDQATFVWKGTESASLVGDFNGWGVDAPPISMTQAADGLWTCTLTLPDDAYIEYGFLYQGERLPDPLNPHKGSDGLGHINSFLWMPNAIDTPLAQVADGVPSGSITRFEVASQNYVVGESRTVHLYQPPTTEPVPLMIVFDGTDYLEKARLAIIVDNLIAQGRIRPIAMALVDPGGTGRTVEYACSDATVAYVIKCVLPTAQKHLNLIDIQQHPGAYTLMGASMGGLMSLYTALRAPEIFGSVLCESGAFEADHLYYKSVINDLIDYLPPPPITLWMDAGKYEWYLKPNRNMLVRLQKRGFNVTYAEHNSGHNYPSWRNHLWRGLEYLFGGKS